MPCTVHWSVKRSKRTVANKTNMKTYPVQQVKLASKTFPNQYFNEWAFTNIASKVPYPPRHRKHTKIVQNGTTMPREAVLSTHKKGQLHAYKPQNMSFSAVTKKMDLKRKLSPCIYVFSLSHECRKDEKMGWSCKIFTRLRISIVHNAFLWSSLQLQLKEYTTITCCWES